jgi:hypothetical protein
MGPREASLGNLTGQAVVVHDEPEDCLFGGRTSERVGVEEQGRRPERSLVLAQVQVRTFWREPEQEVQGSSAR